MHAPVPRLDPDRIDAARARIAPPLRDTPLRAAPALSRRLGCELVLKDETVGPLGSFKGRGADLYVARLLDDRGGTRASRNGMVCASAGNFGLALADAGRRHGVAVTVFVAHSANPLKVERIRACGATVVAAGSDFDAAKDAARAHASAHGALWVEDGAEIAIAEGAGTIACELDRGIDAIYVPVGNGALAAGIGAWLKARRPDTRVIGVCSAHAPVMRESWLRGSVAAGHASAATIADGIAVRVAVPAAVADLAHVLDEFVAVPDALLRDAMRWLHADCDIAAEPSAVAGIAAVALARDACAGRRVATVLTGANLTAAQRAQWLGAAAGDSSLRSG
jgi:threonine dehydratase